MGTNLMKLLLSRLDPKWIPAIVVGVGLLFTIIYLVYTKKKLDEEKQVLKGKLALAKSSGLNPLIEKSQEESMLAAAAVSKAQKQIKESRERISMLEAKALAARVKLAEATSWEDLGL